MVFERKKAGQANEDADSDTPEVKAPGPILQLYFPQLPMCRCVNSGNVFINVSLV